MCESVIGSSRAMRGLQTGPRWCESVAPFSVTLEQGGGQVGHAESPGCDGYLWGRVTASSKGALEGGGHWESPPSPCCLFTEGATVPPGVPGFCLCKKKIPPSSNPPPISPPHHTATVCSREMKNLHQLLPPIHRHLSRTYRQSLRNRHKETQTLSGRIIIKVYKRHSQY